MVDFQVNVGSISSRGGMRMYVYPTNVDEFLAQHRDFLNYLLQWRHSLKPLRLEELVEDDEHAKNVAFLSVDLIKGFTTEGPLASDRIAAIVQNVVDLLKKAYDAGVRDFILVQDRHPEDSLEFESYGRHAAEGSREAETADDLLALPFSSQFIYFYKKSLSPAIGTGFDEWIEAHPWLRKVVVVGDCTDLCVYQSSMFCKMWSNVYGRRIEIIVPENCVQTYHVGVEEAKAAGLMPHDGDLFHLLFLYHMALNSIRVVTHIE